MSNLEALRCGKWKLHFPHKYRSMKGRELGKGGKPGKYNYQVKTEQALYDLEADIGETTDVVAEFPEVVAKLTTLADEVRADLGDKLTDVKGAGNREPGRVKKKEE